MTMLRVEDVTKVFDVRRRTLMGGPAKKLRAVDGVTLEIGSGETIGLVGESGCGKSTLGRLVVQLLEPTSGRVMLDGVEHELDNPEFRRSVQIVFQDPYTSLPPRMNVGSIIAEPLRTHDVVAESDLPDRVRELLADARPKADMARALPHELSGGQRQRVSIARALAVEPDIIVADEAVSALDVSVQAQILNLMKDLQASRGLAFLFISHDLGVVRYMSDRIAVMYLGRIVELGATESLVEEPLHTHTRALLSAVPSISAKTRPITIRSEPPNPVDPPSGCAFHPRCPIAQPICSSERPELHEWLDGRWAACHFALESGSEVENEVKTGEG